MHLDQTLVTTSTGSILISFFASTLPVVQWFAALLAAITGGIFLFSKARDWYRKHRS